MTTWSRRQFVQGVGVASLGPQVGCGRLRFAERLLTVVATCRQQGRHLLDFVVAAGEAALRSSQPPSLLPAAGGAERLLFPYVGISGCPCWIRKNRCADCQPVDSQEAPRAL